LALICLESDASLEGPKMGSVIFAAAGSGILDILKEILAFFPQLDDKTKLLFVVFLVLGGLAYKICDALSTWAKLAVFFTVAVTGCALALLALFVVGSARANLGAAPPDASPARQKSTALFSSPVVLADDRSGWVYCGKFDEQSRRSIAWSEGVKAVGGTSRDSLPTAGVRLTTTAATDLYYDHPRFTVVGLQWSLAAVKRRIPPGAFLTIGSCRLFGQNGWCEVEVSP
jgi:hypothetical protein